ncbi:MAG: hypothetical protein E5V81_35065, partial [Mesorhizobium sp.]
MVVRQLSMPLDSHKLVGLSTVQRTIVIARLANVLMDAAGGRVRLGEPAYCGSARDCGVDSVSCYGSWQSFTHPNRWRIG